MCVLWFNVAERYHKLPIYFTGKKTLINRIMQEDIPAFEDFADGDQGPARITAQVVKQANELVVSVYANMGDMFEGANLGKLRVHTFLNNKSTLLTLLYRPRRAHMNNMSAVAQLVECRTRNRESPGSNPRCYRFEVWAFSFTSRRLSRLSCINEYLAIDSGGNVSE